MISIIHFQYPDCYRLSLTMHSLKITSQTVRHKSKYFVNMSANKLYVLLVKNGSVHIHDWGYCFWKCSWMFWVWLWKLMPQNRSGMALSVRDHFQWPGWIKEQVVSYNHLYVNIQLVNITVTNLFSPEVHIVSFWNLWLALQK